jgi:hypothetical protein
MTTTSPIVRIVEQKLMTSCLLLIQLIKLTRKMIFSVRIAGGGFMNATENTKKAGTGLMSAPVFVLAHASGNSAENVVSGMKKGVAFSVILSRKCAKKKKSSFELRRKAAVNNALKEG